MACLVAEIIKTETFIFVVKQPQSNKSPTCFTYFKENLSFDAKKTKTKNKKKNKQKKNKKTDAVKLSHIFSRLKYIP